LRLVASKEVNLVSKEPRINVIYELNDGQKAAHVYTRGTPGVLGTFNNVVDYPVYLTLSGPWNNTLAQVSRPPYFHGKNILTGNLIEKYYQLSSKGLLLHKAYDPVIPTQEKEERLIRLQSIAVRDLS